MIVKLEYDTISNKEDLDELLRTIAFKWTRRSQVEIL